MSKRVAFLGRDTENLFEQLFAAYFLRLDCADTREAPL